MLSVHSLIAFDLALDENLCPSNHVPVLAISFKSFPLSPNELDAEVQNGITVFPVKSFSNTKLFTGQADIPHQIG